jgi:HAD superfamily hydrolase (TIGR01509 family)
MVIDEASQPADERKRPVIEELTTEELERFLARARAQGRQLTAEERALVYGGRAPATPAEPTKTEVHEMEAALLDRKKLAQLTTNFFPELGDHPPSPRISLVHGVIFDFDFTLAYLATPIDELMEQGARAAESYMRSMGMELPADFWQSIVEARRFAQEKSEQEQEEHIADDAMSFLLQFFGYPASKLDRDILARAVDIFYAPEMTAWRLYKGAREVLEQLHAAGYKLAVLANYNCDRVFQRIVDYLGIRPYFDVCLCSASVEYRKPDVRFFNVVLDRWGALPYEVVVVGDSLLQDIQGGLDLGALTVHCCFGTTPQVEHDNAQAAGQIAPDATIRELGQLPAQIYEWAQA